VHTVQVPLRYTSKNLLFLNITVILSNGWTQAGHKKEGDYKFFNLNFKKFRPIGDNQTKFVLLGDDFYHPNGV